MLSAGVQHSVMDGRNSCIQSSPSSINASKGSDAESLNFISDYCHKPAKCGVFAYRYGEITPNNIHNEAVII